MKKYQLVWTGSRSNRLYSVEKIVIEVEAVEFDDGPWVNWKFNRNDVPQMLIRLFQGKFPNAAEFEIVEL